MLDRLSVVVVHNMNTHKLVFHKELWLRVTSEVHGILQLQPSLVVRSEALAIKNALYRPSYLLHCQLVLVRCRLPLLLLLPFFPLFFAIFFFSRTAIFDSYFLAVDKSLTQ